MTHAQIVETTLVNAKQNINIAAQRTGTRRPSPPAARNCCTVWPPAPAAVRTRQPRKPGRIQRFWITHNNVYRFKMLMNIKIRQNRGKTDLLRSCRLRRLTNSSGGLVGARLLLNQRRLVVQAQRAVVLGPLRAVVGLAWNFTKSIFCNKKQVP